MYCFRTHYQPQKTKFLAQATTSPKITINNYELEVVDKFIYLWSTISIKLSLDRDLDRRIGMTSSTLARLGTCVCGKTPDSRSRPKCITTLVLLLVHFYTKESPKIFTTQSLVLKNAILGVPSNTTKMCANGTWRNWVLVWRE